MVKKVISIEAGVWWSKVSLVDYRKKNPPVYQAFAFRTPEHAVEDGYIRDKDRFAAVLKEELRRHNIREREVVFTLSSSKVVTREVLIPFVKDNKISGIIDAQIRDYFPMDVSNYTVSYSKMDVVEEDGKKQIKLLLVAIPDNLLNNYCTFAEMAGLKVETFDYIGNGTVQLMRDSLQKNAVIVQLEEQSTVISILENQRLVFQRVTPYGYGATLSTILEHPILGIKDEYEAFDFLLDHNVLYNSPAVQQTDDPEDDRHRQRLADEAYEDLAESLRYHLRIANTAIEYYQNQTKREFDGYLYLVGDGSRFMGVSKMFEKEIPVPVQKIDFSKVIDLKSEKQKASQSSNSAPVGAAGTPKKPRAATPVGFLSVIGAAVHPIDAKPKELREADSKKNGLRTAYIIFAGAAALSLGLILVSTVRQIVAVTQHHKLQNRIDELSYVQEIYDQNNEVKLDELKYEEIYARSVSDNEQLLPLVKQLEKELPTSIKVESLQTEGSTVNINMVSKDEVSIGQMLLNMQKVTLLRNIQIPAMKKNEDEGGNVTWTYTVNAYYSNKLLEDVLNTVGEESTANE